MKKILLIALVLSFGIGAWSQEELAPYYGVKVQGEMTKLSEELQNKIVDAGFQLVGAYQVAGNSDLLTICFTNDYLKDVCAKHNDRGALASVLKMALKKESDGVEISLLHPNYMFHAYFGRDYEKQATSLNKIDSISKAILESYGQASTFGGSLKADDLEGYHYKVMMPYFDDPIELEAYASFDEGLKYIQDKIDTSGDDIKLVYQVIDKANQTAVFGLGFIDLEKGEPYFLPIIGDRHIAAMPYEIILQGTTVSMLHGKYRFALYWPELSMGTFMKIMSTPGDVEDAMESLTEKVD